MGHKVDTHSDSRAPYVVFKSGIAYFSPELEVYRRHKRKPCSTVDANMKRLRAVAKINDFLKEYREF